MAKRTSADGLARERHLLKHNQLKKLHRAQKREYFFFGSRGREILRCSGRPVPRLQGTHEGSLPLSVLPEDSSGLAASCLPLQRPASGPPHCRRPGCAAAHLKSEQGRTRVSLKFIQANKRPNATQEGGEADGQPSM
jgi:hypothetical protein